MSAQREPSIQPEEAWFRARRSDQGTGYGLIHWKGGVAVVLIVLVCAAIGSLPPLIFRASAVALAAGFALGFVAFTILLLAVVRAKAERWEG